MYRKLCLVMVAAVLALIMTGCFSNNKLSLLPDYSAELSTRLVKAPKQSTKNRILILDVDGVITDWGESKFFYEEEATTTIIRKKLEKAVGDERIKAVVLRVNSPGGTVTGSDIVYREIMKYKQTAKVPVVAAMMGVAASGGYYVSCSADLIVAHQTTITGSIGVIMHSFGFDGLFKKIGMESRVIKAGKFKDAGNPFAEMSPEQRQILQTIVDQSYDRFVQVIDDGRPNLNLEQVRALGDGRVMTAQDALRAGLVDKIGDLDDAIGEAMRLANIRDAGVILYSTNQRPEQNIFSETTASAANINLDLGQFNLTALLDAARPRIYYLWLGF